MSPEQSDPTASAPVRSRTDHGLIQRLLDDPDQHRSEERARRLLQAAQDDPGPRCAAQALLGCVLMRRCDVAVADPLLAKAVGSAEFDELDELLRINAWLARAKGAFLTTRYRDVPAFGEAALEVAQDTERRTEALLARAWISSGLAETGRYEAAVRELQQVISDAEVMDVPAARGQALNYMAVVHEETDDFEQAEALYLEAEAVCRDHNRWALGRVLANYGDMLVKMRREDEAGRYLERAIDVLRSNGDYGVAGWCHWSLGRMHMEADRDAVAREHFKLALSEMEEVDAPRLKAEAFTGLGKLAAKQGDYQGSVQILERALAYAESVQAQREVYNIHCALAEVHEQFGDTTLALYHHKRYHSMRSEVYDELGRARLTEQVDAQELERSQHQRELWRLRHVELKEAHEELLDLHARLESQARDLKEASIRDPLTGMFNRRYFDEQLSKECARAGRYGAGFSLALCDLDEFKQINDSFSHAVGDKVLVEVGRLFTEVLRQSDVIARYGGEEIAILLPNTSLESATFACEKLRQRLVERNWARIASGLSVTISIGLAEGGTEVGREVLLQTADERLYRAKRGGRNRVVAGDDVGL
jgi:diguanylate cyclase (GGDEF)-like protein